jgi:hypothetical protein
MEGFAQLRRYLAYPLVAAVVMVCCSCQTTHAGPFDLVIADVSPRPSNELDPQGPAGRAISLSAASDGRRMYAGTWGGGLWRSDDAGANWKQIVSEQPGDRVLPPCDATDAPARLAGLSIVTVAVSPRDPDLVFAGTGNDRENCAGLYRSADGGNTWRRVFSQQTSTCPGGTASSVGNRFTSTYEPVSEVAFAPDDPTKLWAVAGCVVAFSTVGGETPDSAPPSTYDSSLVGVNWTATTNTMAQVSHLAVGKRNAAAQGTRAVWSCSASGVWSSIDGGRNFVAVPSTGLAGRFVCGWNVAAHEGDLGGEHLMAAGDTAGNPSVYLMSPSGLNQHSYNGCGTKGVTRVTRTESAAGTSFDVTTYSGPIKVPSTCGSGQLSLSGFWSGSNLMLVLGDDEDFYLAQAPPSAEASWHRLTGVDADAGCTTTACRSDINWGPHDLGSPSTAIHDDGHAFAIVPGTNVSVGTAGTLSAAAGSCTGVGSNAATMVMSNDGGVVVSSDCGVHWQYGNISTVAASELDGLKYRDRLPALYFGGRDDGNWFSSDGGRHWHVAIGGCGDCTGFYAGPLDPHTISSVFRWNQSGGQQGCCRWLMSHTTDSTYPNPTSRTADFELTPHDNYPRMVTDRGYAPLIQPMAGEAIPTLPSIVTVSATPSYDSRGNLTSSSNFVVHRVDVTAAAQTDHVIGSPGLRYPLVQTAGGVVNTTFYAAGRSASTNVNTYVNDETDAVYRAEPPATGTSSYNWTCIVPSDSCTVPAGSCPDTSACHAYKLAVDPYGATGRQILYVADSDGVIKESVDSGRTWFKNASLTAWMTDQQRLANAPHCQWRCAWGDSDEELHRVVFLPDEPGTAFAVGIEGVFMTLDAGCALTGSSGCASKNGELWHRILDSTATPCQPNSAFFDGIGPEGRALYISCNQRGILDIWGIPLPSDRQQLDAAGMPPAHLIQQPGTGFRAQPHHLEPMPPERPPVNHP